MLFLLLEGRVVVLFVDEEGDSGRVDGVEVRSGLYFGERVGDFGERRWSSVLLEHIIIKYKGCIP